MGLTNKSSGLSLLKDKFNIELKYENQPVIALAGNPNTGKSTLFNYLTGLNQHTGNWPGKTVNNAQGYFKYKETGYLLVDLPGTYSLLANSVEEEIARDFICFGNPSLTIVIADSTCLERNLNLILQITELTDNVIACLNLSDEANRKGIHIDTNKLEEYLGIPVVKTVASNGKGVDHLLNIIDKMINKKIKTTPYRLKYNDKIEALVNKINEPLKLTFGNKYNTRWLALRLIDGDKSILRSIEEIISSNY